MARTYLGAVLLWAVCAAAVAAGGGFGSFVGQVETRWKEDGRRMELLSEFRYIDPAGLEWDAPKGWVIDGASIPAIAWSIVGGPYEGRYRPASVIHDVACDRKKRPWENVHLAFYQAMRAAGVGSRRAKVMYAAVYFFGPRWPFETVSVVPEEVVAERTQGLMAELASKGAVFIEVRDNYVEGVGASGMIERIPTGMKEVVARVTPPANTVSPEEFERLKRRILSEDMPLERIRDGDWLPSGVSR